MKMKYLYQALSVLLIINCGGGGGSSSDSLPAPVQVITPQPLFKEFPIKLIDAVSSTLQHAINLHFNF